MSTQKIKANTKLNKKIYYAGIVSEIFGWFNLVLTAFLLVLGLIFFRGDYIFIGSAFTNLIFAFIVGVLLIGCGRTLKKRESVAINEIDTLLCVCVGILAVGIFFKFNIWLYILVGLFLLLEIIYLLIARFAITTHFINIKEK